MRPDLREVDTERSYGEAIASLTAVLTILDAPGRSIGYVWGLQQGQAGWHIARRARDQLARLRDSLHTHECRRVVARGEKLRKVSAYDAIGHADALTEYERAELELLRDVTKRLINFDGGAELLSWVDAHRMHDQEPYIGCPFCRSAFVRRDPPATVRDALLRIMRTARVTPNACDPPLLALVDWVAAVEAVAPATIAEWLDDQLANGGAS